MKFFCLKLFFAALLGADAVLAGSLPLDRYVWKSPINMDVPQEKPQKIEEPKKVELPADNAPQKINASKHVAASKAEPRRVAPSKTAPENLVVESAEPEVTLCDSVGRGEICDARDGHIYKVAVIGSQTWFAENLAYEAEGSWCPGNREESCKLYGRLYQWWSANSCPEGWHLPNMEDFETLSEFAAKSLTLAEGIGSALKATAGWDDGEDDFIAGTDRFGFKALPAGYRDPAGRFVSIGGEANFWTSQEVLGEDRAAYWNLYFANKDFIGSYVGLKSSAMSVRCIKE